MFSQKNDTGYTTTIGIECHVQLKTNTKLFSGVGNDARHADPNTLISHICLGMPGALPVLNEEAIHLAIRAAFALGVDPQLKSKFDRKHYFYPDLPKGYQITQFDEPIIVGGKVIINVEGHDKKINITRAHLEEDAGKSIHPEGEDYSLVDLNRAGTPLLEIVSEPEMHTPEEAKAYAKQLYLLMRYAGVSEANLFYGNMRFDVNVSVSKSDNLGTRTETKNLNSFRSVEKAVHYETKRQIELLDKGLSVIQETRGWDDAKQKTFSQRTKEDSHDYRYFPDPDIPPLELDQKYVDAVRNEMPIMPDEWKDKLNSLGLDDAQIDTLILSEVEYGMPLLSSIYDNLSDNKKAKFMANWYINVLVPIMKVEKITLDNDERSRLETSIYLFIEQYKLSSTNAKSMYHAIVRMDKIPIDLEKYAVDSGYIQESDEAIINEIVASVLKKNPEATQDIKNGQEKAVGFIVGQIMKESKGKANPALAQKLIRQQLKV